MNDEVIGLEAVMDMSQFVRGVAQYNTGIDKMYGASKRFSGRLNEQFRAASGVVLGFAKNLSVAVVGAFGAATAAATAFVVDGVKNAIDFEQQMQNVKAVLMATTGEMQLLKDEAANLGLDPRLKVSAAEAAAAMEMLAKNGLSVEQILGGAAEATILLANSTGAEFAEAADIGTDAMAIFGIEAENMSEAVNGIVSVTTASKFGIRDYAYALGQGGGAAAAAGVNFEDFNTAIAGTSSLFKAGSDAGTSFKVFTQRLAPTSKRARDMIEELGLSFFDAQGNIKSMGDISVELNKAFADMSDEQKNTALNVIFGSNAMRTAIGMIDQGEVVYTNATTAVKELGFSHAELEEFIDGGITKFELLQLQMRKTDAAEAAATRMDSLAGALDIMQGVIESISLAVGDTFIPLLRDMTENATVFLADNQDRFVSFFQSVADALGTFVQSIRDGSSPLQAFFDALRAGGVDADTIAKMEGFVEQVQNIIGVVREFVEQHGDKIQAALTGIGIALGSMAGLGVVASILAAITSPLAIVIGLAAALGVAYQENFLGLRDAVQNAIPVVKEKFDELKVIVSELIVTLKPIIEEVVEVIGVLWAAFKEGGGAGMFDALLKQFPDLERTIKTTMAKIQPYIDGAAEVFNVLKTAVMTAIEIIKPSVEQMMAGIGQAFTTFSPVIEKLQLLFTQLAPVVVGVLSGLFALIVGIFNGLVQAINPFIVTLGIVLDGVLGVVTGVFTQFGLMKDFITAVFTGTSEEVDLAWNAMKENALAILQSLVDIVVGLFQGLGVTLVTFVKGLYEGVVGWFQQMYDKLVGNSIIPDLVNAAIAWFMNWVTKSVAWIMSLKDQVIAFITEMWESTVQMFTDAIMWLVESVAQWVTNVVNQVVFLKDRLVLWVSIMWTLIKSKFTTAITAIKTKIAEWKDDLLQKVVDLKDQLIAKVTEMWDKIKSTFSEKVQEVVETVRGLIDSIFQMWEEIDWEQLGRSIIDGVQRAITNGADKIIGGLYNMAANAIEAVKSTWQSSSPSKVFYRLGWSIPEGLEKAWDEGRHMLGSAMRRMMESVPGIDASPSLTQSFAANGGTTQAANTQPNTIGLDASAIRALQEAGARTQTTKQYNLNTRTSLDDIDVADQFRIMEALG
jgi:TP901 family phage tail tape measure protein